MRMRVLAVCFGAMPALGLEAQTVEQRYELGWRLQQLEQAWAHARSRGDTPQLGAAAKQLEFAVESFFRFDAAGAAHRLDLAALQVSSTGSADERLFVEGFSLDVRPRLVDASRPRLVARLGWIWPESVRVPEQSAVDYFKLETADRFLSAEFGRSGYSPSTSFEVGENWNSLQIEQGGDFELRLVNYDAASGLRIAATRSIGYSVVRELDSRLAAARQFIEDSEPERLDPFALASIQGLLDLLESLADGGMLEIDVPANRWLEELERRVGALVCGERFLGSSEPCDHWIAFPRRRRSTPARLLIPRGLDAERPAPLVIALHGAGGSEHMFFEAYGNGRLVELARERGWLVVSPRHALLAPPDVEAMVAALGRYLPIDAERVAVVGHSMGAVAGIGSAERAPQSIAALVAMGGGRPPKDPAALAALPVHVAVGEHDFGRAGGEALYHSLGGSNSSKGAVPLELHVVAGAEHLMVVQDGLNAAFAFLDRALAPGADLNPGED